MFEPQKLITVGLAALLLAPFGYVFWQIATHRARPEAQVRAELEAALRDEAGKKVTPKPDGGVTITSVVAVRQVEALGFFQSTMSWLSFFPRPWVGVLGLFAVACILVCLIVSLFFPGGTEMSVRDLPTPSPATETPR
jgi:TRAP-type C4-dicarboxylate transport system permease small subunit